MRIALTVEYFDRKLGGEQVWVGGLAHFLASRHHDVHVVTFIDGSVNPPFSVQLLNDPGSVSKRARLVDSALLKLSADVVHDSGAASRADLYQPAAGSALHSEERFIAASDTWRRLRSAISPRAIQRRSQLRTIERKRAESAGRILAPSRFIARLLASQHGINEKLIPIVPNGVDVSHFDARRFSPNRAVTRARLGIGSETVFLMVANNLVLKGADIAIKAFATLRSQGHLATRLFIAGGLPNRGLANEIVRSELGDAVRFLGYVEDVAELMTAADVFLHPTRWDTCSLVTSEAMACSLPVVTSGMNGASELISHGYDGFVCADPEDVEALVEIMTRLLDPTLRFEVGKNARRRIEQFDIANNYSEVERHLIELAKRRR